MDFTLNVNVSVTSTSALPMTNDYWVGWLDGRGQYMGRIILDTFNVHINYRPECGENLPLIIYILFLIKSSLDRLDILSWENLNRLSSAIPIALVY